MRESIFIEREDYFLSPPLLSLSLSLSLSNARHDAHTYLRTIKINIISNQKINKENDLTNIKRKYKLLIRKTNHLLLHYMKLNKRIKLDMKKKKNINQRDYEISKNL